MMVSAVKYLERPCAAQDELKLEILDSAINTTLPTIEVNFCCFGSLPKNLENSASLSSMRWLTWVVGIAREDSFISPPCSDTIEIYRISHFQKAFCSGMGPYGLIQESPLVTSKFRLVSKQIKIRNRALTHEVSLPAITHSTDALMPNAKVHRQEEHSFLCLRRHGRLFQSINHGPIAQ